jgi:hypothetical protein
MESTSMTSTFIVGAEHEVKKIDVWGSRKCEEVDVMSG